MRINIVVIGIIVMIVKYRMKYIFDKVMLNKIKNILEQTIILSSVINIISIIHFYLYKQCNV